MTSAYCAQRALKLNLSPPRWLLQLSYGERELYWYPCGSYNGTSSGLCALSSTENVKQRANRLVSALGREGMQARSHRTKHSEHTESTIAVRLESFVFAPALQVKQQKHAIQRSRSNKKSPIRYRGSLENDRKAGQRHAQPARPNEPQFMENLIPKAPKPKPPKQLDA